MPRRFPEEIAAWRLPERLTVSEHSDKYRVLRQSAKPGPWRTDNTPYLREVMDAFADSDIEEIVLCTGTQVGKTESINNALLYVIHQDPAPSMLVYPTVADAESISKNRLEVMFRACRAVKGRWEERRSTTLEMQFWGMFLALCGANSASSLASKPIRYLFLDEVDKYPPYIGDEGDPINLAKERLKTYTGISKCLMSSTPTVETGNIWTALTSSDDRRTYRVPCPHCGAFQKLEWQRVKWPEDLQALIHDAGGDKAKLRKASQKIRYATWYECSECGQRIADRPEVRMSMLRAGHWESEEPPDGPIRRVGYHLSSLYSPWVSWGRIAAEWVESYQFPEALRNFINSWLAEPWIDKAAKTTIDEVLAKRAANVRGEVPKDAKLLTSGVDVQKDHFWYEVRAWGVGGASWLVDYGRLETWRDVKEAIVDREYSGKLVNLALIDSGYRPDDVYDFCSIYGNVCVPSKGASARMLAPYTIASIDKDAHRALKLIHIDTSHWKNYIWGRIRKPVGDVGSWHIYADCPPEYAEQICSEQRVMTQDRRTGKITEEWRPIGAHAMNHLFDCAVLSAVAADIQGVRYLGDGEREQLETETSPGWIQQPQGWLQR